MNQYEGWYGIRRPDQLGQVSFATIYNKPLVCSEFGADALNGHRGPKEVRWTEDFQAWHQKSWFGLSRSAWFGH